jgi:hypothetical protein
MFYFEKNATSSCALNEFGWLTGYIISVLRDYSSQHDFTFAPVRTLTRINLHINRRLKPSQRAILEQIHKLQE